ncbi:FKBP-type peptidyl-prolyl cis-trans isomerase [Methanoregula sp.]|jgi:peptidylprolyl isomerase|uniref:FKBP-type peptidyl-prolyl cis-trans isomerase n=1 Tax=Methanoregula sp. TaxID=2052170 RepID=UPI003C2A77C9
MKKSEKEKGKEKKAAARKQQYTLLGIVAVVAVIIICVAAYLLIFSPSVIAAAGDTVSVTYTGTLDNKTVFDTNVNSTPLTFTVGSGQLIPGFDAAVVGMKVNQEKTVTIPYTQAYGAYNPQLIVIVPQSQFSSNVTPGEKMYERSQDGSSRIITVINVTDAGVAIDANSPLAGQNLTFDIKVDSITKANAAGNATVPTY